MRNYDMNSWPDGYGKYADVSGVCSAGDPVRIGGSQLLEQLINAFDCSTLVIDRQCALIKANSMAKSELQDQLRIGAEGDPVLPVQENSRSKWTTAVNAASLGTSQILALDDSLPPRPVQLLSIDIGLPFGAGMGILVCATRPACVNAMALQAYAKAAGLSRMETRTLSLISQGHSPIEISVIRGVSEFTVRAQIKSLYQRTNTRSMRELLVSVGRLPAVTS